MATVLLRDGITVARRRTVRGSIPVPQNRPAQALEIGSRVTDGRITGRVAARWCDLGDAGREYVRLYLDWEMNGTPWLTLPARGLRRLPSMRA